MCSVRLSLFCDPMDCSLLGSFYPLDYPGKNTGVGCCVLLQIFLTQGLNSGLLHWQVDPLPLSHLGSPSPLNFNYDSGDFMAVPPFIINNCPNMPFGTQGRSWSLAYEMGRNASMPGSPTGHCCFSTPDEAPGSWGREKGTATWADGGWSPVLCQPLLPGCLVLSRV